jgi:hypothetical protein
MGGPDGHERRPMVSRPRRRTVFMAVAMTDALSDRCFDVDAGELVGPYDLQHPKCRWGR